ncbi:MAG: phosphonoacetaldehyde hydrolase [Anaerolineales bacterium]|nr:phosphonoacetaldehyde hydrolase [Anaerolineales bacterium]
MDFVYQRSYRGLLKAVILDWAGTTVDFGSFAPTAVFLRLFEERGVAITPADARSGMGLMKKDHLRTILARPAVAAAWEAKHGTPASEADIDSLFEDFVPMQTAVVKDFAEPIPGCLEAIGKIRERGIKIGSTTGYIRSMMDVLMPVAAEKGYAPDSIVCPDEVPNGRPFPWMVYQNMMNLNVFPVEAVVKVGDTLIDIEEGLNAGTWTVGLSQTGNLMGLTKEEFTNLSDEDQASALERVEDQLYRAGAHYVIDGIWDLPIVLEEIEDRLANGERP